MADYNIDDMNCIVRIQDKNGVIHCGYQLDGKVYRIPRSDGGSQPTIVCHTTELEFLGVPDNAPSSMDIEILEERTSGNSQGQVDEDIQDVPQEVSSGVANDVTPITKRELQEHQFAIEQERATLLARLDELAQAEVNWNLASGTMVLVDDDGIPLESEDKMSDTSVQDDTIHDDLPALDRVPTGLKDDGTYEPDQQYDITDATSSDQDHDIDNAVSADNNEGNTSLNYKQMLLKEGGNPYQAKPRDSTSGTSPPTINRTRSEDIGGSQPWEVVPGRNKKKKKDDVPPRNFLDRPNKDVRREKNEPASPSDDSTISPSTSVASAPNASVNDPADHRTTPLNVLKHRKAIQTETGSEQGSNYKTPLSKGQRGKKKGKSLAQAVCETMASPFGRNPKSSNESDSSPSNESANSKNSKGSKDSKGGKSNRQNKKKGGSDFH
jgi:hypothetical protein